MTCEGMLMSLHCVALMQALSLSTLPLLLTPSLQIQMNVSMRVYVATFVSTPMEATTVTAGKGTPLIQMGFSAEVSHNHSVKYIYSTLISII